MNLRQTPSPLKLINNILEATGRRELPGANVAGVHRYINVMKLNIGYRMINGAGRDARLVAAQHIERNTR